MSPPLTPIGPGAPCVAVVIPAFNAEETIGVAIRSALEQPEVAQLIVVDDGSTDETAQAARGCDDGTGRLRVVGQRNAGPSAACNHGVSLTTAPVWAILDADDCFAPHRLRCLFEAAGVDWDMAGDTVLFRYPDGAVHRLEPPAARAVIDLETFVRANIPRRKTPRAELGFLQPLMRRAFFHAANLGFDPSARFAEDYMLYAQALSQGARFVWVRGPGYVANVTAGSLSHSQTPADYDRLIGFDRRLMGGRQHAAASALRTHMAAMRLKGQYRRFELQQQTGRIGESWRTALADPGVAAFVFDHHCRPALMRELKRLAGFDSRRELLPQIQARLAKRV